MTQKKPDTDQRQLTSVEKSFAELLDAFDDPELPPEVLEKVAPDLAAIDKILNDARKKSNV